MADDERIMLPRLGVHLRTWGSGHVCDSDVQHDGDCVCECGITAPYDFFPASDDPFWEYHRG